ncbi:Aspartyl/glutamyl-tRNA(Asn/Gln) amidotransferase subunit C [archaeon HR06]|nr:Aspartyl/glutamyl-tRNA(Asn/Gln) amidotransferase subunit C [archaeon HR06]
MNIEKLASLAKIKLSRKEKEKIEKEILEIISYFNKINSFKGSLTEEDLVTFENRWREDIPEKFKEEDILNNIPKRKDRYVKAPKIW